MVTYPKDWRTVRIGDLVASYGGLSGKSKDDFEGGQSAFITYMDVYGRSVIMRPSGKVRVGSFEYQNTVSTHDLLFTQSSETPDEVGKVATYGGNDEPYLNSFCFGATPRSGFNSSFLVYYLSHGDPRARITLLAQGSTRYNLAPKRLLGMEITIPNESEQRAIAEVLSGFDEHLASLDELIAKKKAIRDGAIDELVLARRRIGSFSDPWVSASIPECADVLTGLTYSPDDLRKSGVLVLRSSNIQNDTIYLGDNVYVRPEAVNSPAVERGDILVCVRNGSVRLIGKTAQIDGYVPTMSTFGAFMSVLRPTAADAQFLFYYTRTRRFKDQVTKVLGATINQITKRDLAEFDLLVPPLEEQRAIAEVLSGMDEEIRLLEEERVKVERLKLGAMDDLLTGRVRLPIEEEAA